MVPRRVYRMGRRRGRAARVSTAAGEHGGGGGRRGRSVADGCVWVDLMYNCFVNHCSINHHSEMKSIQNVYIGSFTNKLSATDYFLLSTKADNKEVLVSFLSMWYNDDTIDYELLLSQNKEMREISLVEPEKIIKNYKKMGQNIPVINTREELLSAISIGGHALVGSDIVNKHWREITKPFMTLKDNKNGFIEYDSIAGRYLKRFAVGDYRTKIFDRDGCQCRVCGSSPDDSVHVRLEVHHIKPWEEGGLSTPENLITLCSTCHSGINMIDRASLFKKVGLRLPIDKIQLLPLTQSATNDDYMTHLHLQYNAVTLKIKKNRVEKLFKV
jgi:hypothetical protein